MWAGSDVRRRWRSLIALGLLAGVTAGLALAATHAAQRSASALDRLRAHEQGPDVIVFPSQVGNFAPDWDAVADLPEVEAVLPWALMFGRITEGPEASEVPVPIVFTETRKLAQEWAYRFLGAAAARPERRHVLTVATEHKAVLDPVGELRRLGYDVTVLAVDRTGLIDLGDLESSLRPDTLLVSVMAANNETGTLAPIEQISAVCSAAVRASACNGV